MATFSRYSGDLRTLDLTEIIEYLGLEVGEDDSNVATCDCPMHSSHKGKLIITKGEGGIPIITCSEPACDGLDLYTFLALVPRQLVDSCCSKERKQMVNMDEEGKPIPNGPNTVARGMCEKYEIISDKDGRVWEYNKKFWVPVTEKVIRKYVMEEESGPSGFTVQTQKRRHEIAGFILTKQLQQKIQWRTIGKDDIPLKNGVLNAITGEMRAHNKSDMLETVCPVEYDPEAQSLTWVKCLYDWFGDDDQQKTATKVLALQQFFGYCLLPHAKFKKCLFCYGDPDTGKSQIGLVLHMLLGAENVCGIDLNDMDDPRKRAPIKGKMLNLISDLSKNAIISDGGFKSLVSTGDPISIDQKYMPGEMYIPFAKHVIVSNNLPRILDTTDATFNRLLIIHFDKIIPKIDQDRGLLEKLQEEIEGILNWAVMGAAMLLRRNGEFEEIMESEEIIRNYKRQENPIYEILDEHYTPDPEGVLSLSSITNEYNDKLRKNVSARYIGSLLRNAGYGIVAKYFAGKTQTVVTGLTREMPGNPWT